MTVPDAMGGICEGEQLTLSCCRSWECGDVDVTVTLGGRFEVAADFADLLNVGRCYWTLKDQLLGFRIAEECSCPNCEAQLQSVIVVVLNGEVRYAFAIDSLPAAGE
jgi:hypothetical protein